ncbi:uncharacterized protein NEMAJ01_0276 [Nematocida major]|uniref:uncharacterized protein n=1 Tax=Nematocida major TaxID=1912982 RepID=UPI0020076695|nr:uncharacterized protein NEMAJ01_0276 [Nematocida major]KAH9385380.1 hypothetical protein NEMAJ01_0276 [Nematocida major]
MREVRGEWMELEPEISEAESAAETSRESETLGEGGREDLFRAVLRGFAEWQLGIWKPARSWAVYGVVFLGGGYGLYKVAYEVGKVLLAGLSLLGGECLRAVIFFLVMDALMKALV